MTTETSEARSDDHDNIIIIHIVNMRKILLAEVNSIYPNVDNMYCHTGSHAIFILLYRTKLHVYSIYSVPL